MIPGGFQEGLGEDLGSILESLGEPWRGIVHKKVLIFCCPVLVGVCDHIFNDCSLIVCRFLSACVEGFVTGLANSETSILAAIYYM